jgi:hypothetical protein
VHRGDNVSDRISEQHRNTVGDQRCHRQPGLRGDQRIAGRDRLRLRTVDHSDGAAVHLLHPDHALGGQSHAGGKPFAVGGYRFRTVTHVLA